MLRGRTFPLPLELRLLAEPEELLLWLLLEVLVVLGRLPGLLLPEGRLVLGEEALGLLLEGAVVPEGRLPLELALPVVGVALPEGVSLLGCEETGLFSAKTGSFTAGFS